MKLRHDIDVAAKRKDEYPPIGDQLDAMVALAEALRAQGFEVPAKTQAWIDACNQVKCDCKKV